MRPNLTPYFSLHAAIMTEDLECAVGSLVCCVSVILFAPFIYYMVKGALFVSTGVQLHSSLTKLNDKIHKEIDEIYQITAKGINRVNETLNVTNSSTDELREILQNACTDMINESSRAEICFCNSIVSYDKVVTCTIHFCEVHHYIYQNFVASIKGLTKSSKSLGSSLD